MKFCLRHNHQIKHNENDYTALLSQQSQPLSFAFPAWCSFFLSSLSLSLSLIVSPLQLFLGKCEYLCTKNIKNRRHSLLTIYFLWNTFATSVVVFDEKRATPWLLHNNAIQPNNFVQSHSVWHTYTHAYMHKIANTQSYGSMATWVGFNYISYERVCGA